jgi:hypothetical protein
LSGIEFKIDEAQWTSGTRNFAVRQGDELSRIEIK